MTLFFLDGDPWTSNTQCDTIIISEINRRREVQISLAASCGPARSDAGGGRGRIRSSEEKATVDPEPI
jgi:hypothetical protein